MLRSRGLLPWLATLVVAAAPAYLLRFSVAGIPTTGLEILIYFFVAAVVVTQWGRFRPVPRRIIWPVVLFLLAAIISTVIAPDKREALGILKGWIIDPLLFVWALWQIPDREKTTRALMTGLLSGGLFVALVAVYQRITGQVTFDGRVIGPYAWSAAENASPNYLALYLAPLAVLSSGLAAEALLARRWPRGTFLAVAFALMTLAIFLSFSRGGLAALVVGIAAKDTLRFWPWIRRRAIIKAALVIIAITAVVGAGYYIQPNPLLSPEEGGRITASNNVRWEIWRTTVREVIPASPLLGVGLGNFQPYFTELTQGRVNYDRIAPLALTPHNLFLALWVNLGLLGLVAVLWLLVDVFRRMWRQAQSWTVAALVGALVALAAHGLLDTPYFKNDLSLLFWTLIALLVMWSQDRRENQRVKS